MNSITAPSAATGTSPPAVLLVEDESLLRLDTAEELAAAGFAVLEAATADEALLVLENGAPVDLVFSDVQMPGSMDGMGLRQTIARRFPWIPVVLTSARAYGFAENLAFIPKPYFPKAVIDYLAREMARVDGSRAASSARAGFPQRRRLETVKLT